MILIILFWAIALCERVTEIDAPSVLSGAITRSWESDGVLTLQNGVLDFTAGMSSRADGRRVSSMWFREPVSATTGVDLTLNFEMTNNRPDDPKIHGFAVWYIYNRPSDDLLFGGPSDYNGIGAFFSTKSRSGAPANSVSGLINDGNHLSARDIPSQHGVYWNFRGTPMTLKLTLTNGKVTAQAKSVNSERWNDMFNIDHINGYRPGGYLGITAMAEPGSSSGPSESIRIMSLVVDGLGQPAVIRDEQVQPAAAPAQATQTYNPQLDNILQLVSHISHRLDRLSENIKVLSTNMARLEDHTRALAGMPQLGEKVIGTSVEVLSRHLSNFKAELDDHKRITAHLVSASNEEKNAQDRLHMQGIKSQVERHAKVTWLLVALMVVTVGFVGTVVFKSFGPAGEKAHAF